MELVRLYPSVTLFLYCIAVTAATEQCGDDLPPLLLTAYLKAGKIEEARKESAVHLGDVTSYSGYFTVNEDCGSNLFFWAFLAEENWQDAPVLLWLNGGPGVTTMVGLFQENGPWDYRKNGFVKRKFSWTKKFNVIFFDEPVGTGFSFTEKDCYVQNMTALGKDMTSALFQFFQMFPKLQKNKFFLTGESYAGHYIPAIAVEIDKENAKADVKINMVGITVGNPYLDPQCVYIADYINEMGIIDKHARDKAKTAFGEYVKAINAKNYTKADELGGDAYAEDSYQDSNLPIPYNILDDKGETLEANFYQVLIRKYDTRKQLHVGSTEFHSYSIEVGEALYNNSQQDGYDSISPYIEYLLKTNKYIVGLYAGQLDLICLYRSIPCVLRQLDWSGKEKYLAATRLPWYVSGRLAGWYKTAGNLFEIVVRDSGHMVPTDQAEVALAMISAIALDQPGSPLLTHLKTTP